VPIPDPPFAVRYGPWAVVAGGSDGTGAAFAHEIARRGVNVVVVARRAALLDALVDALRTTHGVEARAVALDLSGPDAPNTLHAETADLDVGLLVYNAGADEHMSLLLDLPDSELQAMVRRNCASVLGAVHHYGGRMVEWGRGAVVLVTSGAAWAGGSHIATYAATKAFDLVLAESLWAEWRDHGVDVLALVLGTTDTPSLRRLLERNGREFGELADPNDVAVEALDHLGDGPTWSYGMPEPQGGSPFGSLPRRDAVLLMSQGSAALLGEPVTGASTPDAGP